MLIYGENRVGTKICPLIGQIGRENDVGIGGKPRLRASRSKSPTNPRIFPRRSTMMLPMPQRQLQQDSAIIDLLDLNDFNVQLARVDDEPVATSALIDLVTEWMNDNYQAQLRQLGYTNIYAAFDTVILLDRKQGERLLNSVQVGELYTAQYKGAALFTRNATQQSVPQDVVGFIQETTLTNKTGLLELLQLSPAAGLGSLVVDLNAAVAEPTAGSSSGTSLEAIIIIAVVVAAVAFLFLLLAIFWAWRYDRRNREAYLVKSERRVDPTGSNSTMEDTKKKPAAPMSEIGGDSIMGGGIYPESVISEDISTSLSQYYRSGLGSSSAFVGRSSRMDHLNDAASVSSMESYGYSLDGYAPSMTAMPLDIPVSHDDDDTEAQF